MSSDLIETRGLEIELILPRRDGIFPTSCPHLDANYFIEDRRAVGIGFIISEDMPKTGNLDQAVIHFLTPIRNNAAALKALSPILSILIYNHAFTCTMNIKCLALIALFCNELDIRVYPTSLNEE